MCTGKCSRCIGLMLIPLAFICIAANLLLIFPNAEKKWVDHITLQVWLMGGIVGGGLFILCPGCAAVRAGGKGCCGTGCCGNRCRMLRSVFSSIFGGLGSLYCLVVSATALGDGPLCFVQPGAWEYPFQNLPNRTNYLANQTLWDICIEPKNIVMWHVVLFSILLASSGVELVLCGLQVVNAAIGVFCGDCRRKPKQEDGAL
ncbi:transmembrane 4 L6 family member 5 [Narcine bancroftii]|uniref:transmembrane 4 L6 family member 5 n=1 Tax=Narcine bancroftii TaxID=1343680 RepID=UPI0038319AAE